MLDLLKHRQICAVEGRDVVVIEREFGSAGGYFLYVFHQFLYASYLGEGRSHGADAPRSDFGGVAGEFAACAGAAAAHVHYNLESFGSSFHPCLGEAFAFVVGEHIALARRSVDEYSFESVFLKHGGVGRYGFEIHVTVGQEGGERRVDESFDFFHCHIGYI